MHVGISSLDAGTRGQTASLFGCGRTHLFYSWSWYYITHFKAVGVAVTRGHRSNLAAISTTVGATTAVAWGTTLFGRCTAHIRAIGIVGTYGHNCEQHYCRRDRASIARSVGKLPCSGVVLTFVLRLVYVQPSSVLPPPYTLVKADAARFYTVSCANVYCAALTCA